MTILNNKQMRYLEVKKNMNNNFRLNNSIKF